MIAALALLAVFLAFAALMYLRVVPAIFALPAMAFGMMLVVGVPLPQIGSLMVVGASSLAPVYVTVIFGALLARVTLDTGIARALVNLAAEYGGESPPVLALVLALVVALLFVSLSGLGAIIMVGSIVLPIMMTTGVPRTVAATLFLMSFALGFIFNPVNWTFYVHFFGVGQQQMMPYALLLAGIDVLALLGYALVAFSRERGYATWAVRAREPERGGVPAIALATPILPIVLYFALHLDPTLSFLLSAIFGAVVARPRRAIATLVAAAIRGVEDVAAAVLLFIGIGMLLSATKAPQFAAALQPLVSGGWASNPFAYVAIFGLLSPLVLYRGPLNPFGVGIVIFTVLLSGHALAPLALVAAVMAVSAVQNVCDPTNTANVWVANFTGVPIDLITKRTLPFQVAVATLACVAAVLGSRTLFGARLFTLTIPPAYAAGAPGFYADAGARDRIGVDSGSDAPLSMVAARAVANDLNHAPWSAQLRHGDPNASDCSGKPYAAFVVVTASQFTLVEGTDLDIGLRLEDCGGWVVTEWHDHAVSPGAPTVTQAVALALEGTARMREWSASDPRAPSLFARGVAVAPGDPPSYFYTLFKTVDGNMRAYVRAGGPAYDAGLRTGDVVMKLDGRFWWEYGTFQTQLRAYDGKPHSFEVQRGAQTLDIQLGSLANNS
ncbi:MAG TPA: hypothetical protein VNF68_12640 [Candidatus Baltobacteraceae bacterium]|nr:hypothetical protein [Candidatus Baltobacteraceae bacterium]